MIPAHTDVHSELKLKAKLVADVEGSAVDTRVAVSIMGRRATRKLGKDRGPWDTIDFEVGAELDWVGPCVTDHPDRKVHDTPPTTDDRLQVLTSFNEANGERGISVCAFF
jgi:hypothetical protein